VRAKIIQYNPAQGDGIAVAEGQQYDFNIRLWRSSTAPATGQTVDITLEDGAISAVSLVATEVLAKERASQLASGLGVHLSAAGSRLSASAEKGLGRDILQLLPIPVLVAYVIFVLSALVFNIISMEVFGMSQGVTMWGAGERLNIGGINFLLILAFLSIVVPVVWRDKRAWFAMLLPIFPLLKLWYGFSSFMNEATQAMGNIGFSKASAGLGDLFSIGLGGYGTGIAAVFLAGYGLKRTLLPAAK